MSKVPVDREEIEAVRNTLANGGGAVGVLRWAESVLAAQPAEAEGVGRWSELKKLAEKATPGPWVPFCKTRVQAVFGPDGPQPDSKGTVVNWPGFDSSDATSSQRKANAKFIAAANPATVLSLIAALSAVTAERDALAARLGEWERSKLAQIMRENVELTAERDRLESMLIRTTTRHFAQQWKDRTDDKKLDECLSEGIAMLEAERDQYRAEVEASGWIPLTKATPPDGVPVLRWPGWAAEFSIDEWCNDYGCFLMSIEGGERATHWKPLCAPKAAMAAKEA